MPSGHFPEQRLNLIGAIRRRFLKHRKRTSTLSIDGLSAQIQNVLHEQPFSGPVFVFRGRRGVQRWP